MKTQNTQQQAVALCQQETEQNQTLSERNEGKEREMRKDAQREGDAGQALLKLNESF